MVKFGFLLPTRESVMYGGSGDPRPLVDMAVRAEELGFDSVWVGDSLLARPRSEPLTLLAGVATVTSKVELGTAVLLSPMRNPEQLAQTVGTLDALSGGRVILGIGTGPGTPGVRSDYDYVGADFDRRGSRSIEVVERMRALWSDTADGPMYPLPVRPAGPPVWIGGSGPRTLERVGSMADGWFPIGPSSELAPGIQRVRDAAAQAGRDPADIAIAAYLTVNIGSSDQAQSELEEHSERYYGVPHKAIAKGQGSTAGSAEHVAEWIRAYLAIGVQHLCIRVASPDAEGQLERLAEVVADLRT